nr:nucleotidyl transferase AbiEii/AbiGii toxin family protein [Polynucleobacter sp. MWH-UH25E]
MNGDLLREHHCYFGGGTAIALLQDEYRESVDIDFLISDKEHYRELRNLLTDSTGIYSIAKEGAKLVLAREIKADQYGIRTAIQSGDTSVKFEIVLEGRIVFDEQSPRNNVENISTLTKLDLLTSKLLANSDRWNDSVVYSRDILDLVMLSPTKQEFDAALKKAYQAYGDAIHRDLNRAANKLLNEDESLDTCMRMLKIDLPKALLWQKLNDLMRDHMKILENNLAAKLKTASNDDLKKFIDQKLKSIDHILEYLKDK